MANFGTYGVYIVKYVWQLLGPLLQLWCVKEGVNGRWLYVCIVFWMQSACDFVFELIW